jgi:hypothetical protein
MKNKKVKLLWLVVTVQSGEPSGLPDTYADIIGIFTTRTKAGKVFSTFKDRKPIPGLNYNYLVDYDDVAIISMPLNKTATNI